MKLRALTVLASPPVKAQLEKTFFDGEPALEAGEQLVRKGPANLFRGIESVGGRLLLTDRRLVFQSHKVNVQTGLDAWRLEEITNVKAARTLLIVPNGLLVHLADGTRKRFVVWQRAEWVREIGARIPLPAPPAG